MPQSPAERRPQGRCSAAGRGPGGRRGGCDRRSNRQADRRDGDQDKGLPAGLLLSRFIHEIVCMLYGILKDTILKGQTQWQFAKGAFWETNLSLKSKHDLLGTLSQR